ncbi:L-threonylcarbamoyladenylate synthase [Costertonia aggregata]|uniref:Threonylcarbamoyl-AMP synthase n=1 Tax=Costertonia aggregata TaxID=343403 RepID=A0A7H9AN86_9FLAO|nr:L-threonylcarbamoyladenylate synthase [Costertonia aggregata]QLG44887.1 threonylcarbamoyl-AMP synthase [Costertonia aggregata]
MNSVITTDIAYCQKLLRDNKIVAIPTETVYGLAGNSNEEKAIRQIFEIKGRPLFNPLIVHIHQLSQMDTLVSEVPKPAKALMKAFWPGPLTLILPKKEGVSDLITAGKPTVGLRMPKHPMTRELLKGLDFPVAAPSANPFTKVSSTSADHVASYFGNKIPAILDGGPCEVGLESTIIGFENDTPIVYRKGGISLEAIKACVGEVRLLTKEENSPTAPGMLLKHYSPNTKLMVSDTVEKSISENSHLKIGVLTFYKDDYKNCTVKVLSKTSDINEAAQQLFAALHELDHMNLDIIIAERFPEEGLGISINDRLERAAN